MVTTGQQTPGCSLHSSPKPESAAQRPFGAKMPVATAASHLPHDEVAPQGLKAAQRCALGLLPTQRAFRFEVVTTVTCELCGKRRSKLESYRDLSLDLEVSSRRRSLP